MANETEIPSATLEKATTRATLPQHRGLTLIGTVIQGTGATALVRLRAGDIRQVSVGQSVGNATVTAIEPGIVHLSQAGQSRRLELPGG